MVNVERGETRALIGQDGKEIRPHISQVSITFQWVGSLLGCQVNAPTTLSWVRVQDNQGRAGEAPEEQPEVLA